MTRAVEDLTSYCTRLNFVINDQLPSDLYRFRFYYTGGSGVLNAVTGRGGSVNSRQEKVWDVTGYTTPLTLPLYTFLQQETGTLNITATALDTDGNTIKERTFEVPVQRNKVTVVEGNFFDSQNSFTIKGETDWEELQTITY